MLRFALLILVSSYHSFAEGDCVDFGKKYYCEVRIHEGSLSDKLFQSNRTLTWKKSKKTNETYLEQKSFYYLNEKNETLRYHFGFFSHRERSVNAGKFYYNMLCEGNNVIIEKDFVKKQVPGTNIKLKTIMTITKLASTRVGEPQLRIKYHSNMDNKATKFEDLEERSAGFCWDYSEVE